MDPSARFIPGRELARQFFRKVVEPMIARHWPALQYSAGLLGAGSDVPGYDTSRSTDHDLGPRCQVVLDDADLDRLRPLMDQVFCDELPESFLGYPVTDR